MNLKNRVAVVTGGADGIGLACAKRFADDGAKVVIGDINDEKGKAEAAAIGASYVHCDVTKSAEVESMIKAAVERHGRLDICVSNAGTIHGADFSLQFWLVRPAWLGSGGCGAFGLVQMMLMDLHPGDRAVVERRIWMGARGDVASVTDRLHGSAARVAQWAGYSDQSHMVRDFRAFAGAPPSQL